MQELIVSPFPHVKKGNSVYGMYIGQIVALMICLFYGLFLYGRASAITFGITFFAYILLEFIKFIILKKDIWLNMLKTISLGLMLSLLLPPSVPIIVCVIASIMAFIFKTYTEKNQWRVNPICCALIFIYFIFKEELKNGFLVGNQSAVSFATKLDLGITSTSSILKQLIGSEAGLIGASCIAVLLVGFIILILTKNINVKIPIFALISFAGIIFLLQGYELILPQIFSGGVLFALIFLAPTLKTYPYGNMAQVFYSIIVGVVFALARVYLNMFDYAVIIALIFCNLLVPIFNGLTNKLSKKENINE